MTVAEAFAEWLNEKQFTTCFGVIGAGNLAIFDAIHKAGKAEIVCCHHEQAAVMASTYFNRTCGFLESVSLVTTGAGSTNAITGVMAAYMDSIPTLIVSGNESTADVMGFTRVRGAQGFDTVKSIRQFCKAAYFIPGSVKSLDMDAMVSQATNGRPGPVWIDFSRDAQLAQI